MFLPLGPQYIILNTPGPGPACAATSFFNTINGGDPALNHSWWACLNKVCKWVVGKRVVKVLVIPRAPENRLHRVQSVRGLLIHQTSDTQAVNDHNTSTEHCSSWKLTSQKTMHCTKNLRFWKVARHKHIRFTAIDAVKNICQLIATQP